MVCPSCAAAKDEPCHKPEAEDLVPTHKDRVTLAEQGGLTEDGFVDGPPPAPSL